MTITHYEAQDGLCRCGRIFPHPVGMVPMFTGPTAEEWVQVLEECQRLKRENAELRARLERIREWVAGVGP